MTTETATETRAELPPLCFYETEDGRTVMITRGEPGYEPLTTGLTAAYLNSVLMIKPTPDQVLAMVAGSMFGWDKPGADPDLIHAHDLAAAEVDP